jgi:hypothetical protein
VNRPLRTLCLGGALAAAFVTIGPPGSVQGANTPTLKIAFPPTQSVAGRQSLTCQSLLESNISGSPDKSLTNGIEGKVTGGSNKIAVSWKDASTMTLLSGAAFDVGVATGAPFSIVKDGKDELVAQFFDGSSISTFVLNKSNGLAIWSKIRSTFPVYGAPTGAVSYMQCSSGKRREQD